MVPRFRPVRLQCQVLQPDSILALHRGLQSHHRCNHLVVTNNILPEYPDIAAATPSRNDRHLLRWYHSRYIFRLSTPHYHPLAVRHHTTRAKYTRSSVVESGRTECRYHRGLRTLSPTTLSQSARQGEEQRTAKSWSRVAFSRQPGHIQDAHHSIT